MNVCQLRTSRLAERQRIGSDHRRNTRCKQVLCVEADRASLTLPVRPPADHADCVASEPRRPEAALGGPVRVPRKELRVLGQGPQGSRREPVRSPHLLALLAGRATVARLLSLADPLSDCSNSSTGNPLPIANRQPEPASRTERFSVPSSKASDVAQNPYFRRDTRRNYPKTEVVTQPELAKLLIAQGGFESSVIARGFLTSGGDCHRACAFSILTQLRRAPLGSRPFRLPRAPSRPPSRPTRPLRRSPRSTRPTPRSRPLRSARPSLPASNSRKSRAVFLKRRPTKCLPFLSRWSAVTYRWKPSAEQAPSDPNAYFPMVLYDTAPRA